MGDAMDRVQQHAADLASDAVLHHQQRTRPVGRQTCANMDCGEAIAAVRTALGAQLCMPCQLDEDRERQVRTGRCW